MSFQERFKGKMSTIGKHGMLLTESSFSIPKQEAKSPLRASVNSILKLSSRTSSIDLEEESIRLNSHLYSANEKKKARGLSMSAQPKHKTNVFSVRQNLSDGTDYTPYTLSDYKNIAKSNYQTLGGLGPSHVGTNQWASEEIKRKRRGQYARTISFNPHDFHSKQICFIDKLK